MDEECQVAFDKVKEYLTNPPVLVPPVQGRPLILYLTVHEKSMGCVLGQHDETGRKEQAIGKNVLRISMGSSEAQTVHALPYYLAYCKARPHKVHL